MVFASSFHFVCLSPTGSFYATTAKPAILCMVKLPSSTHRKLHKSQFVRTCANQNAANRFAVCARLQSLTSASFSRRVCDTRNECLALARLPNVSQQPLVSGQILSIFHIFSVQPSKVWNWAPWVSPSCRWHWCSSSHNWRWGSPTSKRAGWISAPCVQVAHCVTRWQIVKLAKSDRSWQIHQIQYVHTLNFHEFPARMAQMCVPPNLDGYLHILIYYNILLRTVKCPHCLVHDQCCSSNRMRTVSALQILAPAAFCNILQNSVCICLLGKTSKHWRIRRRLIHRLFWDLLGKLSGAGALPSEATPTP